MNIQNFNKKLSKITALADNGNADGHLSALERDLLLSYIRELYDIVLDGQTALHKNVVNTETHFKNAEIPPLEYKSTVESAKKEAVLVTSVVHEAPDAVEEKPAILPPKEIEHVIKPSAETPIAMPDNKNKEKLAELFAVDKIADLSDRLASSQIKDLTKAMGINERIFTQQELFGNNQQLFNDTLQRLNNCQNFDDAKQFLINDVIYQMDWLNESRIKKASTFIKLVKRKFV